MKRITFCLFASFFCSALVGCGGQTDELIDLNKVLDTFQATLDRLDEENQQLAEISNESEFEIVAVVNEDTARNQTLLTEFAKDLNVKKLISKPIGCAFGKDGEIEGFTDENSNNLKDGQDKELFSIVLDLERNRLIAYDTEQHYRDHNYRPRFGGIFTGYMLGSMLSRSSSYYDGNRAGVRKDWGKQPMSSKNYHAAAAKARSSSYGRSGARTRSGSRGFSFGK